MAEDSNLPLEAVERLRNMAAPCCELDYDGDGNCPKHKDYQPRATQWEQLMHSFVPGAPSPAEVKALELPDTALVGIEHHPVTVRPGDKMRIRSTAIGLKEITIVEIIRAR